MQGLKELKVEGLELTACLLLFSGSSMASLAPPPRLPTHTPLLPPPVAPNTTAASLPAPLSLHDLTFTFCYDPTYWSWPETETLPQFSQFKD